RVAKRRRQCRGKHSPDGPCPQTGDAGSEPGADVFGGGTARDVVDAFEPDDSGETGQAQHVALETVERGWSTGHGARRTVTGRPDDAIPANAGIHDGHARPVLLVYAARKDVRPSIVAIQRRIGAVGDRIAE